MEINYDNGGITCTYYNLLIDLSEELYEVKR